MEKKKPPRRAPKKLKNRHLMDHPSDVGVLSRHKNTTKNTKKTPKHATSSTPRPRNIKKKQKKIENRCFLTKNRRPVWRLPRG